MLVSSKDPAGLLVYCFQPRRVVGLAPPPKPPRCVVTYLLPEMHTMALGMGDLICRCEPTPIFEPPDYVVEGSVDGGATSASEKEITRPQLATEPYPGSSPAVRPGQDDFRLAALSFSVRRERMQERFLGFMSISELFEDAQKRSAAFVGPEGPLLDDEYCSSRLLQWEEWGPRWTRFIPGTVSRAWVCYVYMTRFVFLASEPPMDAIIDEDDGLDDLDESKGYIGVLDFNPHGLHESYPARNGTWPRGPTGLNSNERFAPNDNLQAASVRQICKTFDHIQPIPVGDQLFTQPIRSYLPFRRFSSYQPINGVGDPMIDAERILLVEVRDTARIRGRE
jgi:hypothetical protein